MKFPLKQSLTRRSGYATFILTLAASVPPAAAAPVETVLYNFDVTDSGHAPQAALTPGPNGVYYGTTDDGGATGNGIVFELIPPAAGQSSWTENVIYAFSGAPDGATPSSGLLVGADGAVYGVTGLGGAHGNGAVFKLTPPATGQTAWTETVLYSFNGGNDGQSPYGTLVVDGNGVLYGSTVAGGSGNSGTVFSLTPPPAGGTAWTEDVLYAFQGQTDGASPSNGLLLDNTGAIYGMTSVGGQSGAGTVFRLTPPATAGSPWPKTILYSFRGQPDGFFPNGGLVRDGNGVLYGTTNGAGSGGWGTVFSLTPPSAGQSTWLEAVLYNFTGGLDGGSPDYTPVLSPDGTLYGTSNAGGTTSSGTVYALTPPAKGQTAWTEAALASFTGPNGANPVGLTLDASGALVGTAFDGGLKTGNGGGNIFMLTPPKPGDTAWTQTLLRQFRAFGPDAANPFGALLKSKSGQYYGTTNIGGTYNYGAIYELAPPAKGETAWRKTELYSFDGTDGAEPTGTLLEGKNGVLYGVTTAGGTRTGFGNGTVYALVPPAAGQKAWTEELLHTFTGVSTSDGAFPQSGLIADKSGALYGTAGSGGAASSSNAQGNGIVYKLTPPATSQGSWTETIIYSFMGPDGATPLGSLLFGKSGALYGTTYVGGTVGEGTVFQLTPPAGSSGPWNETVLHSFNAGVDNDGAIPGTEQLLADANGALYGTVTQGGANNVGAAFKLAPPTGTGTAWTETLIHSFTGKDGNSPVGGLLANRAGALYGTAQQGGAFNYGTVFKLTPPASGTAWTAKALHSFNPEYGRDGAGPVSALVNDAKGNLYGTAAGGGFGSGGAVFEVTP